VVSFCLYLEASLPLYLAVVSVCLYLEVSVTLYLVLVSVCLFINRAETHFAPVCGIHLPLPGGESRVVLYMAVVSVCLYLVVSLDLCLAAGCTSLYLEVRVAASSGDTLLLVTTAPGNSDLYGI
jgi:hypothetical protein